MRLQWLDQTTGVAFEPSFDRSSDVSLSLSLLYFFSSWNLLFRMWQWNNTFDCFVTKGKLLEVGNVKWYMSTLPDTCYDTQTHCLSIPDLPFFILLSDTEIVSCSHFSLCGCLSTRVCHYKELEGQRKRKGLPASVCCFQAQASQWFSIYRRTVALSSGTFMDSF